MSVSAKIWFAIKLYHPPLNRQASQIHLDWRMLSWKNPTQYFFLCLCLIHYSFRRFKRNIATGKTSQAITQRFPDKKLSKALSSLASVTSPLIFTVCCFRPYKPYIFWKLVTPTIHRPIDHLPITHQTRHYMGSPDFLSLAQLYNAQLYLNNVSDWKQFS